MRKIIFILLAVFVSACCHSYDSTVKYNGTNKSKSFDQVEVKIYKKLFENRYGVSVNIPIELVDDIEGKNTAVCIDKNSVKIQKRSWNRSSRPGKVFFIFHELGHCVFDLEHDNSEFENGEPKSLMNHYKSPSYDFWKDNSAYYYKEFDIKVENAR